MNVKKILQASLGIVIILVIFVFVRELARETASHPIAYHSNSSPANANRKEAPHEIIEQLKVQVAGREAESTEMQDLEKEIQRLRQDIRVLSSGGGLPTGAHLTATDLKTAADVGVDATAICEQQLSHCKRQKLERRSLLSSNPSAEGGSASASVSEPSAGGSVTPAGGAGGAGESAEGGSSAIPPVSPAVAELQRKLADLRTAYDAMMIDKRNLTAELARLSHNGTQEMLRDENVRWGLHECKSYACVNSREKGECRNCFNMSLEVKRWQVPYLGTIPMAQVWQLKPPGSLRIGLDVGGGSGSFAAHMARYNVTILTTSMNKEFIEGVDGGLPYMETIALRGRHYLVRAADRTYKQDEAVYSGD
ncbi:unnamed protein product [Closterium sp. NIES-64]|nr:unnamed protein product [Closterium sp. NIES-64]